MTKSKKKKGFPLIGLAVLGAGAYLLLNTRNANAQTGEEMPPAGIGSGYGAGAMLGTAGSGTTSQPITSGENPNYNINFEAPIIESQNYDTQPSYTTKKETQTSTGSSYRPSQSKSIEVGGYSGTATPTGTGGQLVSFNDNAKAVTMTKKEVQQETARSNAPVVAIKPVGNSIADVVSAGNVATIFAQSVAKKQVAPPLYSFFQPSTPSFNVPSDTKTPSLNLWGR